MIECVYLHTAAQHTSMCACTAHLTLSTKGMNSADMTIPSRCLKIFAKLWSHSGDWNLYSLNYSSTVRCHWVISITTNI